jgi:hypothetical protein
MRPLKVAICDAGGVSDTEPVISELVAALHATAQRFNEWALQLTRSERWSSGTSTLNVVHWTTDGHAAISGYVEGERDEVGTFTWMLDLIREGDAWRVGRSLTVNTNSSREQEVVAELRGMRFDSTRQLAADLVPLADELLELPAPE